MAKFYERLKIPRSARTVEIVVNIPESITQTSPKPIPKQQESTRLRRVWRFTKAAGPIVASVAALAISTLALLEQRSVDVNQAAASQRQEAESVSFLAKNASTGHDELTVIGNLGKTSVHSPVLSVLIGAFNSKGKETLYDANLILSDIPACSSATIDITQAIKKGAQSQKLKVPFLINPALQTLVFPEWLTFADSNGLAWRYFRSGGLQQEPQDVFQQEIIPTSSSVYPIIANISYKPANGCS